MALGDIISAAQVITGTAAIIQQRAENVYRASNDLEQFKQSLADFERQYKSWESRLRKYGLEADVPSVMALEKAKTLFEKEKLRLESLDSCWRFGCLFMLCGVTFPTELTESLRHLNQSIQRGLQEDGLADADAEERVKVVASREGFRFREDPRYIRLPTIEGEIRDALEHKDLDAQSDVRLVLLEGQSGTGKSSMARYLALLYEGEIGNKSIYQRPTQTHSEPKSSQSKAHDCHPLFDQVLFLECGEKIDPVAKQAELIKLWGWTTSLDKKDDTGQGWAEYLKGTESQSRAEYVKGILSHCLKKPRILLILDDVWNEELLEDVAACMSGDGSRIMVTSQRSRLSESISIPHLQLISISMDRISKEDAHLILEVHAGFTSKDSVPEEIKECMADLIEKISTNPHALASVAATIDKPRRGKLSEWQNVIGEQDRLWSNDLLEGIKFQGVKYFSSIGVKFAHLNPDETDIMVLVSMLEGASVPEEVIQLFYTDICSAGDLDPERTSRAFSRARKQLEDLRCVKVIETKDQFFWSIHFLDREFLVRTAAANVQSMLTRFQQLPRKKQGLQEEPQKHLVKLLGVLYLRSDWADAIMGALPSITWEADSNIERRNAVQRIFTLMARNFRDGWSLKERSSIDQILLTYMCHGTLHERAAKLLLASSISKQVLLDTVIRIVKVADISLSHGLVMDMLGAADVLKYEDKKQTVLRLTTKQCDLLFSLASPERDLKGHLIRWSLCQTQIVLGLIKIFKSTSNDLDLRQTALDTVGLLGLRDSFPQSEDRVDFLVKIPMLLREVAGVLEDDNHPILQNNAARALSKFSTFAKEYGGVKLNIIETTGRQLVRSLGKSDNMQLQKWAVWALTYLAIGGRQISLIILDCPHALDHILAIIGSQNNHEDFAMVRQIAIQALVNILRSIFPLSEKDSDMEGLRERAQVCLLQLLDGGHNIPNDAEKVAVWTLTRIDPLTAKGRRFVSADAISGRGAGLVSLGLFEDALSDLNEADKLYGGKNYATCMDLMQAKAGLKKWDAALKDGDRAVAIASSNYHIGLALQERGVLKHMMKDLQGALKDLEDALKVGDPQHYECLKHRAYVKFLLGDEDGARKDGEEALPFKPSWYDLPLIEFYSLGASTVEFLNFRL